MKFEVKRSEWYRGHGGYQSALFVDEDFHEGTQCRCCLGFFGRACGLNDDDMHGVECPSSLPEPGHDFDRDTLEPLRDDYVDAVIEIVRTNDDEALADEKREEKLTELFAGLGHEVVFVD